MKKLITFAGLTMVMVMLVTAAFGQMYGFNGTNVPENLTPDVRTKIVQMHPAGDTVCMVFRNDKYTGDATISDLQNVISLSTELQASGRKFALIYTFNTRGTVTIDNNFFGLNYFLDAGIKVIALRLGNEEYFKAAGHGGNWNTYWNIASPINTRALTYGIPILIPIADYHDIKWNPSAAAQINSNSIYAPDVHFYWGKNDLPIYSTLVTNEKGDLVLPAELSNDTYLPNTDNFYKSVYDQITTSTLLEDNMDWFASTFPTKKIYVTEYGAGGNPGGLGGAIGFEAANDWFLSQSKQYAQIRVLCKFNGPSVTGIITKKGKLDPDYITDTYVERLAYFTLKQFYYHRSATELHNITTPGTYTFSIHNLTRFALDAEGYVTLDGNLQITSTSYEAITGDNFYSSSGQMAWWANGSSKTYEISGAGTYNFIPALSYGYLTVTVESIPVYGCMDKSASNYNPDATIDDGSCVVITPVCYRKRWLFSSLPCKPAKTNCNCSPSN